MENLIFSDFHHASLLNSLILLFEKRLGYKLFRPIGIEWAQKGYWKIYDHPATQEQYLGIGGATPDNTPRLNDLFSKRAREEKRLGIYRCQDIDSGYFNRAITYEGFMKLPFEIVIASIPQHIEPFKKLCQEHFNKPKLVYQIGNSWNIQSDVKNVMASALVDNVPEAVNFVSYHQEFDLDIFYPTMPIERDGDELPKPFKKINSYVNCFNVDNMFKSDWELFLRMEEKLPDWDFKSYGGQCRDGSIDGTESIARSMRESRFIWHTKNGGDGYGHIIHNSAAVARPVIVKKEHYRGKLGEKLLIDGETCLAIDNLSDDEIVNKIEYFSRPGKYKDMCEKVYKNFKQVVDFDKDANNVKQFIDKLLT